MPSGVLQLFITGAQDKLLISNPQMSYFKQVYMKYSSFSIFNYELPITSQYDFGSTVTLEIPKNGDLLRGIQIKIQLPQVSIDYNNPLDVEINNVKKKYSYKSINLNTYDYNLFNLNTFENIIVYQQGNSSNITKFELFWYDSNTQVETYNVIIPKIDLNQFISPSATEYFFEINPDQTIFSNSNITYNFPYIETPIIETNYDTFYTDVILYSNRNNQLSSTLNIAENILKQNNQTTLLTSDNIKNILMKNIKNNIFQNQELAGIDSLKRYIDSIRFVRPITLYNDFAVKNIIHGGDNDLIGYPEYSETYYNTIILDQILIQASVSNQYLSTLDTRMLYVFTPTQTDNQIYCQGNVYNLYNILKIDYIETSVLDSDYNSIEIVSYNLINYTDLFSENISLIQFKITPFSTNYDFELNSFSELFKIDNIELLFSDEYKITTDSFASVVNLIGTYIYFYYNITSSQNNTLPFCILKIKNFYYEQNKICIIAVPLNYGGLNFTKTLTYFVNNEYIFEINQANNNDFDLKKISIANIDLDSINIYNYYINQSSNVNFNLNGTIDVENSQKELFETNFNKFIVQNIYDNYAILNNIISSAFKNPTDYTSILEPINLYFQVGLVQNANNNLNLSGIGTSTFTNINNNGELIMVAFLQSILNVNFDGSTITNNYFLTNVYSAISKYSGDYQNNWNSVNNSIQNSTYMNNMVKTINYLQYNNQYILLEVDANINILTNIGKVDVLNLNVDQTQSEYVTSIYINNNDIKLNSSNTYNVYLYLDTFSTSNISNVFNIFPNYQLNYNGSISNISNIYYADTNYSADIAEYLLGQNRTNNNFNLVGNYILQDYLFSLLDYYKKTYQIYLNSKNYVLSNGNDIISVVNNNILYKYVVSNFHQLYIDIHNRILLMNTYVPLSAEKYFIILTDYLYLTDVIKINNFLYNTSIITFYNKYMINGYNFINTYSSYYLLSILGGGIVLSMPNYVYFSSFINYTIENDSFFNNNNGSILKTYIFYVYGNQLLAKYNLKELNIVSIQDDSFNYESILDLINLLNTYGVSYNIYDYYNIVTYLNTVNADTFNSKKYQFNMNPHLYYSYLNLGYIENLISIINSYGTNDLNISSYSDFKYADIDVLNNSLLNYYNGVSVVPDFGALVLTPGNSFYSNIITNSTLVTNILNSENDSNSIILNDLITYSTYRIESSGVNSSLIYTCNVFVQDVKKLLSYFNDTLDNLQFIRYITLNDTTISTTQLATNLSIPNFTSLDTQEINDYSLEYFITNQVYNSVSTYRTTYTYNDVLIGFDTDVNNYYNYLVNINNGANIGSSLKTFSDEVSLKYSNSDLYNLINEKNNYGPITISNISDVNTYYTNSKSTFQNYYNDYNNNKYVLDIRDDIQLNSFNSTIKNINLTSGQYTGSLSSMNQFKVYDRKLFGYIVDKNYDYIFDASPSLTHVFKTQTNITNISFYNNPILDTNVYDQYYKTYQYQLKNLQSYFFNDVYGLTDTDLNYIKPYYALENTDYYYYNQLYISQINKLYNYEIPDYVSANIISSIKLDHNFNLMDYDTNRIMNNGMYYLDTLRMLDNIDSFSNSNVNTMVSFLTNNVIYVNYLLNCENNTEQYTYKTPYSLVDWGTVVFFSNGSDSLKIPILNRYVYNSYNLQGLDQTSVLTLYYYSFLYLLFDLYLLDGNMRIKYSDISSTTSTFFNSTNYVSIYRTLVIEYFYLVLRGKQFMQENTLSTIKFSYINNLITKLNYDKVTEYLIYSIFNDSDTVGNGYYDLFNVINDYKIPQIIYNHKYSENFTIIYSIKDSINDKNFGHLIDLTNYNNKYDQFYDINHTKSGMSNIIVLQNSYLANVGITDTYKFIGNLVVTNEDYNLIQQSIIDPTIFQKVFYIDSNIGNLKIDMNDIKYIKQNVIEYYLNEITNSNSIISTSELDPTGNIFNSMIIQNLQYNGNIINDINIDVSKNIFTINKYDSNIINFNPYDIPSLDLWLDSTDKGNIFTDSNATINVENDNDIISVWKSRAPAIEQYEANISDSQINPSWNINGGISFNGASYFNINYNLNTTSTIFLVTDTAISGGYYLYFDGGNVYSKTSMQGPTYWTDGPYSDFIYDDFNFNTEDILLANGKHGKNIFSVERIDSNYDKGYTNNNYGFTYNNNNQYTTGNITMSVFPGYLDPFKRLTESVTGNICEILVFNEVLSDYTKYQINSYLGYKWGIKSKIFTQPFGDLYTFPFDYFPKLYTYNVETNGNIDIQLTTLYDSNFSNIYDNVYLEYKKVYDDINYDIGNNINMTEISKYVYFSDFMHDLQTLIINYKFDYDLKIDPVDFNIINGNIYINSDVLLNYNQYSNAIINYLPNITVKDTYNFFMTPLQFDTNYISYTLMNHGANINSNANLYLQKLPVVIDESSFLTLNTNDRLYNINQLLEIFYNVSLTGVLNYEKLNLGNNYVGNVSLPKIPYSTLYQGVKYSNFVSQIGGDSNVIVLNSVIDISNKKDNLTNDLQRLLNNTNSKIKQTEYEIKNYNDVNQMIAKLELRPKTAVVSWIEKLGIYIADYFEFYIGGQLIERIEDDYMNCLAQLYVTPNIERSFAKMIGQDTKLILKRSKIGTYILYIDIPFYFNNYKKISGLSVPLIALLYNKLNLKFNIKKLEDLLINLPYTKIKKLSKLRMSLMVDYILLDSDERKKFAESKHEYIIEQVQYSNYTGSQLSLQNQVKYNFKNPTKMLIWFAQLKDKQTKQQYYNYTADDYYINIGKYIDSDETDNVYLDKAKQTNKYLINSLMSRNTGNITTDFNELNILKMPFENYDLSVQSRLIEAVQPKSDPLIIKSELRVNGHSRFVADRYETQLVRPYTYYNNSNLNGVNVYNFCLHPFDPQPSGSINFTFLNDISMYLDFNSNNIPNQEFRVKSMTVSYNLLRIMSGYGGLAFDLV